MTHPRWLALLPALVFGHVLVDYLPTYWPNTLWICNLCAGALAMGLWFRSPLWVWVSVLWLGVGAPLWLVDGWVGGDWQPHSFGVHLLCPIIGLVGLRGVQPPRWRFELAVAAMLGVQGLCRMLTPPEMNVNLVFESALWVGVPFAVHWIGMMGALLIGLAAVDVLIERMA